MLRGMKTVQMEIPYADAPPVNPPRPVAGWAGLFGPRRPPEPLHPVILAHACAAAAGLSRAALERQAEAWIGAAIRGGWGVERMAAAVGGGDPMRAWPSREQIMEEHAALMSAWRRINLADLPRRSGLTQRFFV